MTYELIGSPYIENAYCDAWETTMVCDLRRSDGETGDVWIVAGVPDYLRGTSNAARTQYGYEQVRVFGDSPDHWCPASFCPMDGDYAEVIAGVVTACQSAALAAHRARMQAEVAE